MIEKGPWENSISLEEKEEDLMYGSVFFIITWGMLVHELMNRISRAEALGPWRNEIPEIT